MIRFATTVVVLLLAGVAAVVSYRHILEVVQKHGETGWVAYLVPLCIDGLLVAASLVLLDAARRGLGRHWLSWVALGTGIVLTLGANVLHGLQFGPIGAVTSALPSITLTISFELLMGMIRRGAVPVVVPLEVAVPVSGTPDMEISATVEKGYPQADSTTVEEPHVPAVLPAPPAPMPVLTPAPDDLFPVAAERYADVLAVGQVPAVSKIKTELRVGQPRAAKIRTYLVQLAERKTTPDPAPVLEAAEVSPFTKENPPTEADLDAAGMNATGKFLVRKAWDMPDPKDPAPAPERQDEDDEDDEDGWWPETLGGQSIDREAFLATGSVNGRTPA